MDKEADPQVPGYGEQGKGGVEICAQTHLGSMRPEEALDRTDARQFSRRAASGEAGRERVAERHDCAVIASGLEGFYDDESNGRVADGAV